MATAGELKSEWNNLKADKGAAKDELRKARHAIPRDEAAINEAKSKVAAANDALSAQRQKERDYNKAVKSGESQKDVTPNLPQSDNTGSGEDKPTTGGFKESQPANSIVEGDNPMEKIDKQKKDRQRGDDNNSNSSNFRLSDSFYRDVGAYLRGKPTGNTLDAEAATAKAQAQNAKNEGANRQMEAQRGAQIANRNEFDEASKIASVQNNAENKQNINNLSAAAGNSAALMRKTTTPDVQTQASRQDSQANVGNQQREKADIAQQESTAMQGYAKDSEIKSRDKDFDTDTEIRLSLGEGGQDTDTSNDDTTQETTDDSMPEETPDEAPQSDTMPSGNPQHVINWLLGSSKGQDIAPQAGVDGDNGLAAWVQEKFDVQPAALGQYDGPDDKAGETFEKKWLADPNAPGDKQGAIQALRQGRAGEGGDASRNFSSKDYDQMNKSMTAGDLSDIHIKNIKRELSDFRMKCIKEDWDRDGHCSPDDFMWLAMQSGGGFDHDGRSYDFFNDDDWADDDDGSVLGKYADHIKNYLYTYKPEAVDIDPSIDPEEEHIGPMAQDIEQVNPACIKETPEGVKTVDTSRLALMNAGAIGDLARQMRELTEMLESLI